MLTHISLFSGIGASDLAAEWAGFETVLMCEIDEKCRGVLNKIFPGVPIIEDVRNVTRESVITYTEGDQNDQRERRDLAEKTQSGKCSHTAVSSGNQLTFDTASIYNIAGVSGRERIQRKKETCTQIRTSSKLSLLTAGVPCQPASSAGKRRGKADVRWLWPEAIRVLSELQPTWAVFENPVGIASLVESGETVSVGSEADQASSDILSVELSNICSDIEKAGYEVQPVSISAASVGAPHKRQRIFIICHTRSGGLSGESWRRSGSKSQDGYLGDEQGIIAHTHDGRCEQCGKEKRHLSELGKGSTQLNPDSKESGLERTITEGNSRTGRLPAELDRCRMQWGENWIEVAQRLCSKTQSGVRSLDAGATTGLLGLSRTTKLKMLGNCNPPAMYYPIYQAIMQIETNRELEASAK